MIEQCIRPLYQRMLVDTPAQWLSPYLKANAITLLSGLLGVLVIPSMLLGWEALAVVLLLLSGYCDTLDGTVARLQPRASDWGSVLDICTDRLVEFSVIFALWAAAPHSRSLAVILMLGSILLCVTSFLVVGIFNENQSHKGFHYSPGLMERAEAFLFFMAMMYWPGGFSMLAALFCLLVIWTTVVRLREFYAQSNRISPTLKVTD